MNGVFRTEIEKDFVNGDVMRRYIDYGQIREVAVEHNPDSDGEISALARRAIESYGSDTRALWKAGEVCLRSGKAGLREIGVRLYLSSYTSRCFDFGTKNGCRSLMTEEDLKASEGMRYTMAIPPVFDRELTEFVIFAHDGESELGYYIDEARNDPENAPVSEMVFCLISGLGVEKNMDLAAELALYDYDRQKDEFDPGVVERAAEHCIRTGNRESN